ncbi:RNA polymerase factor sigma-54 [Sphingomonas sp. C3-2]|uniref:RNA polymerase factor sigma-54 n=1 Tax=Sphingomonas sp. C3-2 TaxID=3062169 RepID=UPI00294B3E62|nr:RNA polymerase factor sigma-54 [Sphingomonas sp. C3-2]WOK37994.1 RNA polymerase factor sigma-54 [Sphingomonas sp. C3-2]
MALTPRLDLRQSQSLVMTPQLQQAIRLLALSNLEVEAFIAEEVEKNPLLESGSEGSDNGGDERGGAADDFPDDGATASDFDAEDFDLEPVTADQLMASGDAGADSPLDVDYDAETFHHDSAVDMPGPGDGGGGLDGGLGLSGIAGAGPEGGPDFDAMAAADLSLQDHLLAQAGEVLSGIDHLVATYLIDQIDAAGYLEGDITEIAARLGTDQAHVERVLAVIQSFEPTGVGARSLGECLALQAREADRYDPCMAVLLAHLDLLAAGKLVQLKRMCGVDDEDLADMIHELRGYDPKPGLKFGGERLAAVVPDLFVAPRGESWAIEINGATLPRLLVNRRYYLELSGNRRDRGSRAWLSECLASANWLVKALDQRQRTIMKVAAELVKQQQAFFTHGVAHLRPLTLKAVADAIGMHESTVSRVTSNKYLSCGRGLYELKYFFTSAIQAADGGDAVSAEAVKSQIKALIAAEHPKKILSDDTLVDLLRDKGFDIARRTVAKYREAMGIGSSVQRRRQKALQGKAA